MIKDLFQRSGWHVSGLFAGKVLSTVTFILLARRLDPSVFGQALLFITFLTLSNTLGSFGLNQWYQKQKAAKPGSNIFPQTIEARFISLIVSMIIIGGWVFLTRSFSNQINFILLISLVPEALVSIVDGYYLVKKQPLYLVVAAPLRMLFLLGGLILFKTASLYLLLSLYSLASFLAAGILFPWKELSVISFSWKRSWKTLKAAGHYALLLTTSYAYARGDQLIIRYTVSPTALGFYGAAYRYLEGLSLVPSALSQNLFHISARKNALSKEQIVTISLVMLGLGVVTAGTLFGSADLLTTTLLGPAYQPAAKLVRIFSLVLILFFVNAPLATLVQSSDLLKNFLPWGIFNTVLNLILNILLVPVWGITAAAWVMVITEVIGLGLNVFFVKKVYDKR